MKTLSMTMMLFFAPAVSWAGPVDNGLGQKPNFVSALQGITDCATGESWLPGTLQIEEDNRATVQESGVTQPADLTPSANCAVA